MSEENLAPVDQAVANPLIESANPAPTTNEPTNTPTSNTPQVPAAAWPTDWREKLSTDPKEQERLKRFTDLPQVWNSFRQLETKLSSGQYKQELSANPTPEELTAYRQANKLPTDVEGYFKAVPEDIALGDADKQALNLIAEKFLEKNVSPEVFNSVIESALELVHRNNEEMIDAQIALKEQSRHTLYQTWGPAEYKVNINAISNMLQGMPEGLRERFEGAQLADGTLMFNDAEALMWFAQYIRDTNPSLTVMPGGAGDVMANLQTKLDENRNMMRNPSEWWAPANKERREGHAKLIEQYENMKRRKA